MLKRVAFAACLLTLAGAAAAADLPPRAAAPVYAPAAPVFTWTGFYIGSYTGGMWTDTTVRTTGNTPLNVANLGEASLSRDASALMSGVLAGYNVQLGTFVAGIEADIGHLDLDAKRAFFTPGASASFFRQEVDWFGTVRGRLGVAFNEVLVYATGGLAYADVTSRVAFLSPGGALAFAGRRSDTDVGYAVGGGIEFTVPAWLSRFSILGNLLGPTVIPTLKAEYLYFDVGDRNVAVAPFAGVGTGYTSRLETNGHVGKVGFNFRFRT
jgi:outer membrane immunogenic protein